MKKLLSLACVFSLAFVLGCGEQNTTDPNGQSPDPAAPTTTDPAAPTEPGTTEPAEPTVPAEPAAPAAPAGTDPATPAPAQGEGPAVPKIELDPNVGNPADKPSDN